MPSTARSVLRRVLGHHRGATYNAYLRARLVPRRLTARWRREPDYIIIGAQKCGTASLFAYLAEHPQVGRSLKKEVSYFNTHFENGYNWYRGFFPFDRGRRAPTAGRFLTGEATPDYIFDPRVPARIAAHRPDAKLIVLLRDPVQRAFSHYRHNVKNGNESRSFEDALRNEIDVLERRLRECGSEEERARIMFEERRWFYLARGRYHEQLRHWLHHFPRDQMLILRSEDLFRNAADTFGQVLAFLDLGPSHSVRFEVHNLGARVSGMKPDTESWLREYYRPHNRALGEFLGWRTTWDNHAHSGGVSCNAAI
jgi:hypothetical protein